MNNTRYNVVIYSYNFRQTSIEFGQVVVDTHKLPIFTFDILRKPVIVCFIDGGTSAAIHIYQADQSSMRNQAYEKSLGNGNTRYEAKPSMLKIYKISTGSQLMFNSSDIKSLAAGR